MKRSKVYSTITKIRKALSQATKDFMANPETNAAKYITDLNAVVANIGTLTTDLASPVKTTAEKEESEGSEDDEKDEDSEDEE
jgi:hypothetical protein